MALVCVIQLRDNAKKKCIRMVVDSKDANHFGLLATDLYVVGSFSFLRTRAHA